MKKEKSAGAIVFRVEKGKPLYLLLHYPSSAKAKREYWDLPKGHIEKGETEEETVQREVAEETGIEHIELLNGFKEEIHYWFQWQGKRVSKTVTFFLAQASEKNVAISDEHIGFAWLPHKEAIEKLTYQNAKKLVQKANDRIQTKGV